MNQHSVKNRALARTMKQPRKLRTMPGYPDYGMKDPAVEVKKANPGLDNTKRQSPRR